MLVLHQPVAAMHYAVDAPRIVALDDVPEWLVVRDVIFTPKHHADSMALRADHFVRSMFKRLPNTLASTTGASRNLESLLTPSDLASIISMILF